MMVAACGGGDGARDRQIGGGAGNGDGNGDGGDEPQLVELEVAPYKTQCFGLDIARECLFVRREGEAAFENLHEPIEDFEFRWGVAQLIDVEVTEIEDPPQDGAQFEYALADVTRETDVTLQAPFLLPLLVPTDALQPSADRFRLFDEIDVLCEATVCASYEDAIAIEDTAVTLRLAFESLDPPTLRLVQVECAAV